MIGVVLAGENRLGQILADFVAIDVEGGDEFDVAHMVIAQLHVHEAGNLIGGIGILIVMDALDKGGSAVAGADDGDTDFLSHGRMSPVVGVKWGCESWKFDSCDLDRLGGHRRCWPCYNEIAAQMNV